ncbi:MAG: glycosyltransferase [Treponema sp.]|nr:glycosyltransferase [Treponema sp.]
MENKISCIVPVYKSEKFIERCINSLLNQTYSNFELLLIDDGSPDNSGKICDDFALKDSRIKVVHKKNGGVSSARNIGVQNATGNYVCFVDSDDSVCNTYLEKLIKPSISDDVDIVISGINWENTDGKFVSLNCGVTEKKIMERKEFLQFYKILREDVGQNEIVLNAPVNKLYKKEFLNNLLFNTDMSLCEDLVFNLNYIEKCQKFCFIPDCLYNYFRNGSSATNSINPEKIKDFPFDILFYEEYSFYNRNKILSKIILLRIRKFLFSNIVKSHSLMDENGNKNYTLYSRFNKVITMKMILCNLFDIKKTIVLILCKSHFYNILDLIIKKKKK